MNTQKRNPGFQKSDSNNTVNTETQPSTTDKQDIPKQDKNPSKKETKQHRNKAGKKRSELTEETYIPYRSDYYPFGENLDEYIYM